MGCKAINFTTSQRQFIIDNHRDYTVPELADLTRLPKATIYSIGESLGLAFKKVSVEKHVEAIREAKAKKRQVGLTGFTPDAQKERIPRPAPEYSNRGPQDYYIPTRERRVSL